MRSPMDIIISEVFDAIMDESGYREALEAEATDEARTRLDNLEELKNKIVTYEESAEVPTLTGLLEDIALVADTEEEDEDGVPTAKVTLMTLHSAKGLEFPYVFMTGMEACRWIRMIRMHLKRSGDFAMSELHVRWRNCI